MHLNRTTKKKKNRKPEQSDVNEALIKCFSNTEVTMDQ